MKDIQNIDQDIYRGERSLFMSEHIKVTNTIFDEGESPLKESKDIAISDSIFRWKYPLWYCDNITMTSVSLLETARAGIWYSKNIRLIDCIIDAPKTFRQSNNISLRHVQLTNAEETFWKCNNINLEHVTAKGNYFAMNSSNIKIKDLNLSGDYPFDTCKNIEIHDSKLMSKDAFWNCENVTVYNSLISGEYIGWNSKNLTFIDCTIESLQGFCYIENLTIKNCKLLNTSLAFEYSTVDIDVTTTIESIKNPIKGKIKAKSINRIIFDDENIDQNDTIIHERCYNYAI